MSDTLKVMLQSIGRGFRDSVVGMLRVYNMGHDSEGNNDSVAPDEGTGPDTILARRRAERMKTQPSAPKRNSQPKVFNRILLCCTWNGGIFWASIVLFNHILIPCLEMFTNLMFGGSSTHDLVWSYTGPVLSWTFGALWILPLFVLSKVVNGFWFQDIADAAYRKSRGRPRLLPSLSKMIADQLFSLLLQSLFLIQGMLAQFLPIAGIGSVIHLVHMCLLYSLYAFEYKWFNMGWEVHKRLSYIECNWPYFVGFGLPLAILTSLPSSHIVSGCVFSILFPLFIVSGNEAEAIQQPFEVPIRFFSPVVSICNVVFQHSVKKSSTAKHQPTSRDRSQSKEKESGGGSPSRARPETSRWVLSTEQGMGSPNLGQPHNTRGASKRVTLVDHSSSND